MSWLSCTARLIREIYFFKVLFGPSNSICTVTLKHHFHLSLAYVLNKIKLEQVHIINIKKSKSTDQ